MAKQTTARPFRPFVGRLFEFKNFTDLAKYPKTILVMDETRTEVMFLDADGNPQWVNKYYLRATPVESRVYATADTLAVAMKLLERMRTELEDVYLRLQVPEAKKKVRTMNSEVATALQELRDLGTRTAGVQYATPLKEESSPEVVSPNET